MKPNLSDLKKFRNYSPLTHCMTNNVVQNFTANVLAALGASSAMIIESNEVEQFAAKADALLINIGTLTMQFAQSMKLAIKRASMLGKPWILDPVAVGSSLTFRTHFCQQLLSMKPTAIRGNASEILVLSGISTDGGRGVDATDTNTSIALSAAKILARQTNAIVIVTGRIDYVTDNNRTLILNGGDVLMSRVVGTGCVLSAVIAASCALPGDRLNNIATACSFMKLAGKIAATKCIGPGSFVSAFIDTLWKLEDYI